MCVITIDVKQFPIRISTDNDYLLTEDIVEQISQLFDKSTPKAYDVHYSAENSSVNSTTITRDIIVIDGSNQDTTQQ